MKSKKQNYESDLHILIMGILSIFFSLLTAGPNALTVLFIGGIPFIFSILFLVTKHPAFGAICTLFYFFNRVDTFPEGTLLGIVLILGVTGYFAYATYLSYKDWNLRKESVKDSVENKE